jgi:hypothetical protein
VELIHVPAPAKGAFNKHRRLSDLIKAQVKHLKHIEHGLPQEIRDTLPQHPIVTENDAALYIASMTTLLCSRATPPEGSAKPVGRMKKSASSRAFDGIPQSVATVNRTTKKSPSKKNASKLARKSSPKMRDDKTSSKRKK